jgi:hypothetical protein
MEELTRLLRMVQGPLVPASDARADAVPELRPALQAAAEPAQAIEGEPVEAAQNSGPTALVQRVLETERVRERVRIVPTDDTVSRRIAEPPLKPAPAPSARRSPGPLRTAAQARANPVGLTPLRGQPVSPGPPEPRIEPRIVKSPAAASSPREITPIRLAPVYQSPLRPAPPPPAPAAVVTVAHPARLEREAVQPKSSAPATAPAAPTAVSREQIIKHLTDQREIVRERTPTEPLAARPQIQPQPLRPASMPAMAKPAAAPMDPVASPRAASVSVRIGRIEIVTRSRPRPTARIARAAAPHSIDAGYRVTSRRE